MVGDEESVAAQIATVAEAGAGDFVAALFGSAESKDRGLNLVSGLAKDQAS
ncbi:MAG: hypothetical protein ACYCS7_08955 [Acidimicrobiales bacterium]